MSFNHSYGALFVLPHDFQTIDYVYADWFCPTRSCRLLKEAENGPAEDRQTPKQQINFCA